MSLGKKLLVAVSLCAVFSTAAGAQSVGQTTTIDAYSRGWYDDNGYHPQFGTGRYNTFTGQNGSDGRTRTNSFFIFDLSGLERASSGVLRLELERYRGPDPFETFTVFDVVTDPMDLDQGQGGRRDIFQDLQSGAVYGHGIATGIDVRRNLLEVTLSDVAIDDINAAAGGFFAVGIHLDQISLPVGDEGIRFSSHSEERTHQLVLATNAVPVADAGPAQVLECTSVNGGEVTLDGTASYDPDDDPITFTWFGLPEVATGPTPVATAPLGTTEVELEVEDEFGAADRATTRVTVEDTTPPIIDASIEPTRGPRHGEGSGFEVSVSCVDLCDPDPMVVSFNGLQVEDGDIVPRSPPHETILSVFCNDASGNSTKTIVTPSAPGGRDRR